MHVSCCTFVLLLLLQPRRENDHSLVNLGAASLISEAPAAAKVPRQFRVLLLEDNEAFPGKSASIIFGTQGYSDIAAKHP